MFSSAIIAFVIIPNPEKSPLQAAANDNTKNDTTAVSININSSSVSLR